MQDRTCPACGETFTPTWHNQKACPPTDADRARVKGQAVSRCARKVLNASYKRKPIVVGKVGLPFECAQCGTRCTPGEDVVAHASRFCGKQCKHDWHRAHVELPQALIASIVADPRPREIVAYRRALRLDPCAYCGMTPSGIDHIAPKSKARDNTWSNLTGCCKRCNGAKGTLPLLDALRWLPVSREYHDLRRTIWHKA